MHLIRRGTCRVCGSSALTPVIDLGTQHLQGSFVKPGKEDPPMRRITTSLVRCDPMRDESACGLLQMEHTVPPEVLYSAYWYRSGTNNTMRNHLRGIAEEVIALIGKKNVIALDIGCNDGTLLKCYPETFTRFGIDPSDVAASADVDATIVQDLFPSDELHKALGTRKLDIVTSIAMFYDLEDPIAFAKGIRDVLSSDGIWIFEQSYMPTMLRKNAYDTICHEHLEYYSLAVIENILRQADLRIFDVKKNDINGGSFRCYATHRSTFRYKTEQSQRNVQAMRRDEFDLALDTDKPYRDFQTRIDAHREELRGLLMRFKKEGKRIHIYGASTKGNTILQWCGIDHRIIECAAERNPDKYGATTLGTEIPIVSEEESRSREPDYYLVLPWHFREEFLERERELLQMGIGFIFPLPTIEIVQGDS